MAKTIGILLVAAIILGGWYIYKRSGVGTAALPEASSSLPGQISTYENTAYGFAFDYPTRFGTSTLEFTGNDVHDPADPNARFDGKLTPTGPTIEVDAKPKDFTKDFFTAQFKLEKAERANASFRLSTTTVLVGGTPAFAVEGVGKDLIEEEILMEHGPYIYSMGYTTSSSSDKSVIETVLRTFRFLR